ncbi:MAG TPA: Tad domain-containing protein [Candidatus Melainabacteria bacterium]|nr:Tad domain-containing protein [Candidatus Melainabacteria bacterium]
MSSPTRAPRRIRNKSSVSLQRRDSQGSILPLVAFMLALVMSFIAFTADVMRTAYAAIKLQSGVESAALAAYSYGADLQNGFSQVNVTDKLFELSGARWNRAPAGPDGDAGIFESPITFSSEDYSFIENPSDSGESFFRLKARRDGSDAIKLMFVPAIFAFNNLQGIPLPAGTDTANTYRSTEVISQPASRIGEGAPATGSLSTRDADLAGFAAFPLAISNEQFSSAASPLSTTTIYTVDLASNIAPPATPPAAGHIRGAFINLSPSGSTSNAYGQAQGSASVNELIRLIDYFSSAPSVQAISPYVVERGSSLSVFDPEETSFKELEAQVKAKLALIPTGRFQIIPVLSRNPVIGTGNNIVVGFARFRLVRIVDSTTGKFQIQMEIGGSALARNASATNNLVSVPTVDGTMMPAPVAPFSARNTGAFGDQIGARSRGIVMAPSLSPRFPDKITAGSSGS